MQQPILAMPTGERLEMYIEPALPLKGIAVDLAYGRELIPEHFRKLRDHWDRRLALAVAVSMRADGSFWNLDGWHRGHACLEVEGEDATLPAFVYVGLTVPQEAYLFVQFNKERRPQSVRQIYQGDLTAGEPRAVAISEITSATGWTIAQGSQSSAPRRIYAMAALNQAYARLGDDGLENMLIAARDGLPDMEAIPSEILTGLAHFFVRYPYADRDRLIRVMLKTTAHKLHQRAVEMHFTTGIARGLAVGMILWKAYNAHTRYNHLPEWPPKAVGVYGKQRLRETGEASLVKIRAAQALTADDVREIRARYPAQSQHAIAVAYGVSDSQIGRIVRGEVFEEDGEAEGEPYNFADLP